jgi:lipid II:glycine glycyltransferase (peptidoglycan interpeptide bridge formation enzyme)
MGRSHRGPGVVALGGAPGRTDQVSREPHVGDEVLVTVSARPDVDALRRWDLLVATTPRADIAQLSAWAQVRRQAGCAPLFVFAETAGALVGGALVLHRRLPGLGDIGYLSYGPVLHADADRAATADAVCRAIAGLAGQHLAAMFVLPPRGAHDISRRLLQLGFRPFTAEVAPTASLELDLSRPTPDLRKALSSGVRSGIRQATARGVHVRTGVERDLPVVAELLADTAAHHRFPPIPLDYLQRLYQQLERENHIKIFIAECNGVPLATHVLTCCGDAAKLRLTGMRRSPATPPDAAALLQWEALLWAKGSGYASFDFGGISPATVDAVRAGRAGLASRVNGPDYFKASFGGQPFHYPEAVELFSSTAARRGHDLARRPGLGRRVIERARHRLRRDKGNW